MVRIGVLAEEDFVCASVKAAALAKDATLTAVKCKVSRHKKCSGRAAFVDSAQRVR